MKKLFIIALTSIALLTGVSIADFTSLTVSPANQVALSGSILSWSTQISNGTGDAYVIVKMPQTPSYNVVYQNASQTPINNALMQLGIDHDPIFLLSSGTTIGLTVSAKMTTTNWSFPVTNIAVYGSYVVDFSSVFTSAVATISPIADLMIQKIITGTLPTFSGDQIHYLVTVQNIGSSFASGIQLADTFPIPLFGLPSALFNGTAIAYNTPISYPNTFVWNAGPAYLIQPGQLVTMDISAVLMQQVAAGTPFGNTATVTSSTLEYTTGNNTATVTGATVSLADLYINKTMQSFTGYQAGSIVTYTISYGNSGGTTAQNVSIQDIIPAALYMPVSNRYIGTLPAGSGNTIVVTGALLSSMQADQTFVNTASITGTNVESSFSNNISSVTGTILSLPNITLDIQANNLTRPQLNIAPNGSGMNIMIQAVSGDQVQLLIYYGNNGNTSANTGTLSLSNVGGFTSLGAYNTTIGNIAIGQTGMLIITGMVGPQNYISFTPTATLTYNATQTVSDSVQIQEPFVCGDGLITRTEPCDTNGQIGIGLSGQVCENHGGFCVAVTKDVINSACLDYRYANGSGHICDSKEFPLTENVGQCQSLTVHGSNIILADSSSNNYVGNADFTCTTQAGIAQTIVIDCGNGEVHTGTNIASLDATCHFDETSIPANRTVTCSVDGTTQNACSQNMIIDQAEFGRCGDGILQGYEKCDLGDSNNKIIGDYLDEQGNVDAGDYANDGYTCHDCDIQKKNAVIPQPLACFSLNENNVSIQDNEILPFRWNIDLMGSKTTTDCSSDNSNGKIVSNSLKCTFKIFNGKYKESGQGSTLGDYDAPTVKTLTKDCNVDEWGDSPLFDYFTSQPGVRSLDHAYGKYAIDFKDINLDGIYGEYNIALSQVNYKYCENGNAVDGIPIDRVCESDFTVTKPYLAQKSSFGLTPKATTVNLDGYKDIFGNDIIKSTDLDKIMVLDANTYQGGTNVSSLMTTFINKYSKLAIAVDKNKITAFKDADVTVKIVPQQKIYILEGTAGSDTTLTLNPNLVSDTPFTIVTKNINLVVEGNLTTNGMFLVKGGTISFKEPEENRCKATQTVQGIFVTDGGFAADPEDLSNNDVSKTRCPYGGLYVKGVLIGNNIEDLVASRRSQLNHWFYAGSSTDTTATVLAERRNEIFNGAAVLIEYSPSLRTALPPGANEFTTAMDVYKQ